MTAAQEQALDTIREVMREHFDAGIVIARATDENGKSWFPTAMGGHLSEVVGLAHMAKEAIEMKFRMQNLAQDEADYE